MERRGLDALRGAGAGPLLAAGVGCASGAALVFEVVLTSVFAVTQFHHFAFLAVSLALLGFGASGAFLTAWPRLGAGGPRRWFVLSVIQAVSVVIAYAVANAIPFDSFAIAWERVQVLYLALFLVALCVPFLVTGLLIGSLLANSGAAGVPANAVYAASLIGSGAGAALAGDLGFHLMSSLRVAAVATVTCLALGLLLVAGLNRRRARGRQHRSPRGRGRGGSLGDDRDVRCPPLLPCG